MARWIVLILILFSGLLSSCAGSIEIPPRQEVIVREQETPRAVCLVRARLFRGLVGVNCADLAQEFKP